MANTVQRYDPFRRAMSLREAMDRLLQESFVSPGSIPAQVGESALPLDMTEDESSYIVQASLPGIKPEDVQITLQGDALTIRGEAKEETEEKTGKTYVLRERHQASYARTITLPRPVDADHATTQFEHGVLTLTLPKAAVAKPKTIAVGRGHTTSS